MQNYYRFIIPRLEGASITKDLDRYLSLVRKGVAGFIIFGGKIEQVRRGIGRLQEEAELPLLIAADLEQGLGQQLEGGTHLPTAMALAKAVQKGPRHNGGRGKTALDLPLLKKAFKVLADEARYAGINAVLAPVLDINTNPKNPIICTRAFGEDEKTVSFFGCEMINALQHYGIAACGKHFPGHGDTGVDSHIRLPVIDRGLNALKRNELKPFVRAVECGVKIIMLGHLSVPAIEPAGIPVSLSERAVRYLRRQMKFQGIILTDAMTMGGLGRYSEERASLMALRAGVDLLLHPSDADRIAAYLRKKKAEFDSDRLEIFRRSLAAGRPSTHPDFDKNRLLSDLLAARAIKISGRFAPRGRPYVIILNEEADERCRVFARRLRERVPAMKSRIFLRGEEVRGASIPEGSSPIVAVFSETKAWKGGATGWLYRQIARLEGRAELFVSFGSPYLFEKIKVTPKMFVYWDHPSAQAAAAALIAQRYRPSS